MYNKVQKRFALEFFYSAANRHTAKARTMRYKKNRAEKCGGRGESEIFPSPANYNAKNNISKSHGCQILLRHRIPTIRKIYPANAKAGTGQATNGHGTNNSNLNSILTFHFIKVLTLMQA